MRIAEMMIRTIAASAILGALLGGNAVAQEKPALVFTAIPDQDETRLVERFTRVADYLRGKLSVPVRYLPVKSYPAAVAAFVNNQVQLAWFGGFTGVQARRQVPDSEAIAQGAEDLAFKSFFIANVRTGLKPSSGFPKDIAGKSFTFGSRASTSGRLMPEYFIRRQFARRGVLACRLLRRSQPHDPAGAVGCIRARRGRLFRVGAGQQSRQDRAVASLRNLGKPHLSRLSMDRSRRC